jgi:hypothetical protein
MKVYSSKLKTGVGKLPHLSVGIKQHLLEMTALLG